jgi:hypothetical protein
VTASWVLGHPWSFHARKMAGQVHGEPAADPTAL